MAALDQLPPDERAVLQLVLQRGRGYDEIAGMLAIDRAAVRQRALGAFDALGPQTRVPAERRALITDYLLGQLPSRVSAQVHGRLAESASERAWARVIAAELSTLARQPLPEIPVEAVQRDPDPALAEARESSSPEATSRRGSSAAADEPEPAPFSRRVPGSEARTPGRSRARKLPDGDGRRGEHETLSRSRPGPRTSRASRPGGALLLAAVGVILVVVVILSITSSGSNAPSRSTARSSSTPTPAPANPAGSKTAAGTGRVPKVVAQFSLASTGAGAAKAQGVVEVLRSGTTTGVAIVATGLAANTAHPPDAYAVWLYNSASDNHLLGFVNPAVGANGRLSTAGSLPGNAAHFHSLIITLETRNNPKTPGQVVLAGQAKGF